MTYIPPRTLDDGLPDGVNRELSPYWDLHKNPCALLGHMLRYSHMAWTVRELTGFHHPDGESEVCVWDVCCGMAEMFPFLQGMMKARGTRLHYHGFDIDPWKLERARELNINSRYLEFHEGDVTLASQRRAWREELVEPTVVICSETLEHLTKDDGTRLLKWFRKCGAKFLVGTVPYPRWKGPSHDKWHLHEYETEELRESLVETFWRPFFIGWTQSNFNHCSQWSRFASRDVVKQIAGFTEDEEDRIAGSVTYFVAGRK